MNFELDPVRQGLLLPEGALAWTPEGHSVDLAVTGVGAVNTMASVSRLLLQHQPDLVIQVGIAGSFDLNLPPGQVVEVVQDSYADLGAESPKGFLTLQDMGIPLFKHKGRTYYHTLVNPKPSASGLVRVSGITVNTVSGASETIEQRRNQWNAQVESMEGAAFFQAALQAEVPFWSFRAISNFVEPRDRNNWEVDLALMGLQEFVPGFLRKLLAQQAAASSPADPAQLNGQAPTSASMGGRSTPAADDQQTA